MHKTPGENDTMTNCSIDQSFTMKYVSTKCIFHIKIFILQTLFFSVETRVDIDFQVSNF